VSLSLKQNENNPVYKKTKTNRTKIIIYSIIGIGLLLGAEYYIVDTLKKPETSVNGKRKSEMEKGSEKSAIIKVNEASKDKNQASDQKGAAFESYLKKLNSLVIQNGSQSIKVDEWNITSNNGKLNVVADNISSENLESIFTLYDTGNIEPLKSWAKQVYLIVDELAEKLDGNWSIHIGKNCVEQYPKSISSEDLLSYSGKCGYSIPVLSGSSKENLTLILHDQVFSDSENDAFTSDYILPYSGERRLLESEINSLNLEMLRLARNEIYARHGYLFVSEDLQDYFSKKSWYILDTSFKGELNEIEKYNVELIIDREGVLN
jgi:hypothetical protein